MPPLPADDKRPPRALRLFLSPWARPQEGTAAEGLLQVPEPPAVELRPVIEVCTGALRVCMCTPVCVWGGGLRRVCVHAAVGCSVHRADAMDDPW